MLGGFMINPIRATEQKVFNDQQTLRLQPQQSTSISDNGVDKNAEPTTYVERKDKVELNYDVDRYVRMLKNMVVPPKDRFDASILLELELGGDVSAQEVREMITLVERQERKRGESKDSPKVVPESTDADSRGKEA
jgi:hypothetical protein